MGIQGLDKHFAGEVALRDINLDIARGEVHGLIGANGAGKSTLIRCLADVTVPDRGTITIDGAASESAGLVENLTTAAKRGRIHGRIDAIIDRIWSMDELEDAGALSAMLAAPDE